MIFSLVFTKFLFDYTNARLTCVLILLFTFDTFFIHFFILATQLNVKFPLESPPLLLSVMVTLHHPSTFRRCFISTLQNTLGPERANISQSTLSLFLSSLKGQESSARVFYHTLLFFITRFKDILDVQKLFL